MEFEAPWNGRSQVLSQPPPAGFFPGYSESPGSSTSIARTRNLADNPGFRDRAQHLRVALNILLNF
jgi:hypothetical protein